MNRIDSIQKKVDAILKDSRDKTAVFQNALTENEKAAQAAAETAENAFNSGNIEEYRTGTSAKAEAQEAIKVYAAALDRLNRRPLLPEAEYKNYVDEIMEDLRQRVEADRGKVLEHLKELNRIAQAEAAYLDNGNKLLRMLQHDIMKDDATRTAANGAPVYLESLEVKHRDYSVVHFVKPIIESPFYEQAAKHE